MQPAGAYAEVRWVRARVSKHCAKDYCIGMSWGFCGDVQSGLLMGTVRGTYGTGLALVARLGPICRRGRRGCLRGRRGTWRHRPSLCVAGVALGDMDRHLRGKCGTWRPRPSLCAAGVALGDMDRHFSWQAWHLATWIVTLPGRCGTWQHRPSLSGRRGTWRHGSSP